MIKWFPELKERIGNSELLLVTLAVLLLYQLALANNRPFAITPNLQRYNTVHGRLAWIAAQWKRH